MDADTAIGGRAAQFPSTHLSLLDATESGLTSDAMNQVIALYWKPVYRFIRIKFQKNNEDAKDLTQGFFTTIMQRDFLARFDPSKASFRNYLRMAVERYSANQHAAENTQKRGGNLEFETIDDQEVATESPESEFEREWRRQLFFLALDDLRAHCRDTGRQVHFAIFEDYDLAERDRISYSDLAVRYHIPETSVTNYLAWTRRTLKTFITERLRSTTANGRELHDEMRRIWK